VSEDEKDFGQQAPGRDAAADAAPAAAAARLRELRRGTTLPPGETIRSLAEFGRDGGAE
jgi:hypothetical protein